MWVAPTVQPVRFRECRKPPRAGGRAADHLCSTDTAHQPSSFPTPRAALWALCLPSIQLKGHDRPSTEQCAINIPAPVRPRRGARQVAR
jgi:hypothetical protein